MKAKIRVIKSRDRRHDHVLSIWNSGDLKFFSQIIEIVPPSVVAADLGLNYRRFMKKVADPGLFDLTEIRDMAILARIGFEDMACLIIRELEERKKAEAATVEQESNT